MRFLGLMFYLENNVTNWNSWYGAFLLKFTDKINEVTILTLTHLRIFQRNGLKLDKDLIFSGLVQNVYVYRVAKSKKIWPFRFYAIKF